MSMDNNTPEAFMDQYKYLAETYLTSNAYGMADGALKADTHIKLCELFIAERLGLSFEESKDLSMDDERVSKLLRKSTLPLTDNLDTRIGFPLDRAPNYNKMTVLFIREFSLLANEWFDDRPYLMSDDQLKSTLEPIMRRKFTLMFHALSSYGFDFIDGECKDMKSDYLTMKSRLGQIVTVRPNNFFGSNFILELP